ncbi:MAG: FMN-binding protein [Thermotogae bacterium]|nr:FMN-binding protein [Thermotogota bacterium]HOO74131.1 FMN-binding protein [Tepiditoga sp.]
MKKDSKIYTIIFTFITAFVFVFLLAYVNDATKDRVNKNAEIFQRKAILNAFNIKYETNEQAYEEFEKNIKITQKEGYELFVYENNNNKYYAVIFSGNGLWGTITGVIAVNGNVDKIIGIDFISDSETPGLGGRINEESFKEQFKDEEVKNTISMKTGDGKYDNNKENESFDSITGASRTSESVKIIINNNLDLLRKLLRGDANE